LDKARPTRSLSRPHGLHKAPNHPALQVVDIWQMSISSRYAFAVDVGQKMLALFRVDGSGIMSEEFSVLFG